MREVQRRDVLRSVGGGLVLAAGAGIASADRDDNPGKKGGDGQPAKVVMHDQTVTPDGDTVDVTVAQAFLSEGGFVVIHNEDLFAGDALGSVVGNSEYLEAGGHGNVEVPVTADEIIDGDDEGDETTLVAMAHRDTDDDETYDFVTSGGTEDGPYVDGDDRNNDGNPVVIDTAVVTVDSDD